MGGVVERRVRERIQVGQRLTTPAQGKPFLVADMTSEALVLDLAEKWRTPIPWSSIEGIVPFVLTRGSVLIGGQYDTAGWVAAVREAAEILEIDRRRPARVRVEQGFPASEENF